MKALLVILAVMFATKATAMPWPCWMVKAYASDKSEAEIWQFAKDQKIRVTRKLERDVRACIKGE